MTGDMTTRVVRRIGSNMTHVVTVPETSLGSYKEFGSKFTGIPLPLTARCGAGLNGDVAVCMQPGTEVKCRACRFASGVLVAHEDNMAGREVS